MNREETHALYAQGKDAWNAWAERMLAEKKRLEEAGEWAAEHYRTGTIEPKNDATRAWMAAATAEFSTKQKAHTFEAEVGFDGFIFPWTTLFERVTVVGYAGFREATFRGDARFGRATFTEGAGFEGAHFGANASFERATLTQGAYFGRATFNGGVDFGGATLKSVAGFARVTFGGRARFMDARFAGPAGFGGSTFSECTFAGVRFEGKVNFEDATFNGNAEFGRAVFGEDAEFARVTFGADVDLGASAFEGRALFESSSFNGRAWFLAARFARVATFEAGTFSGRAWFARAKFANDAVFDGARFGSLAWFEETAFGGRAGFERVVFGGDTSFAKAVLAGDAGFGRAKFKGAASYEDARLLGKADFEAISAGNAFWLLNTEFKVVPEFTQAHFEEAPRLDSVRLPFNGRVSTERLFQGNRDVPARWRALKRLAIEAHDHENEQRFFAMEMRSARFAGDWPLPVKFWRPEAWAGFFRFWAGLAYQVTSDFGRSVLRPLALFLMITLLAAGLFLKEHHALRRADPPPTLTEAGLALVEGRLGAWMAGQPCVAASTGLTDSERAQTNAANEALHLAFRNSFLVLDGGSDAAHRVYGCLYGLAKYGDNVVPIVPSAVAYLSIVQKLLSAVALFLLGLAVRNMLKMR